MDMDITGTDLESVESVGNPENADDKDSVIPFTVNDRDSIQACYAMLSEFREILMALAPMASAMGIPVPGLASGSSPVVSPW